MNITLPFRRPATVVFAGADKAKKDPFEWLIAIYPSDRLMRLVQLPGSELQAHLPPESRFRPDTVLPKLITGGLATPMAVGLLFLAFNPSANTASDAIIAAISLGLLIGASLGFFVGPRFGPKPLWVAYFGEGFALRTVTPFHHSKFSKEEYEIVADEEGNLQVVPQVWRASSVYQDAQAQDEIDEYKVPDSVWEKIELGLVLIVALSSIGLFALFGVAIAE